MQIHGLECEGPRDTVYGTLRLVEWRGEVPIHPDYNKSPFDLGVEVLQFSNRLNVAGKDLRVCLGSLTRNLQITLENADVANPLKLRASGSCEWSRI